MINSGRQALLLSLMLTGAGLFVPLWALSLLGVVVAALSGQFIAALFLGVLLDSVYGAPVGRMSFIPVPFTLLALLLILVRYNLTSYLREGTKGVL